MRVQQKFDQVRTHIGICFNDAAYDTLSFFDFLVVRQRNVGFSRSRDDGYLVSVS